MSEPHLLLAITEPANPPLDVHTYEARSARSKEGSGPQLTGIVDFMEVLTTLSVDACAAAVHGKVTSYVFLLDAELSCVLASVAMDPPA